jgi:hypothetical protein
VAEALCTASKQLQAASGLTSMKQLWTNYKAELNADAVAVGAAMMQELYCGGRALGVQRGGCRQPRGQHACVCGGGEALSSPVLVRGLNLCKAGGWRWLEVAWLGA